MTGGGDQGAGGGARRSRLRDDPRAIALLAFAGFGLLYMAVNATSLIDERRRIGQPIAPWEAWTLEGTSFAAWLVLVPAIPLLAGALARRPLWQAVPGHIAGCIALSAAHTALMAGLRVAAFAIAGAAYAAGDPWSDRLLFEARKDLITYVSVLAVFLIARRLVAIPASPPPLPAPGEEGVPRLIEIRDGSRVVMLRPEEIDWVGAAGNYVELHGTFGSELARRTMADIAAQLAGDGFVRIYRSRLVRRAAIAAIVTRQSGDFEVTLRSGTVIAGSRRFRQNLAADGQRPAGP